MQVIEKVKVVPEGYNGAGMNYDGGNRRDVNGKANAGLTLGIIGTALGAWALFGNRRSAGASILGRAGGGMLGDGSTNINVLGVYIDGRNCTDALIEKNNTDHFNLYKYTRDADDVEPCDVYVAINAQYHDYAKLFEEWFGGNIDNKVFESAITFWFKDVDFDGDKVWEYFHMNN